jgi:chromosome segregation ATPase
MSNTFPLNKFDEYEKRIHSLEAPVNELKKHCEDIMRIKVAACEARNDALFKAEQAEIEIKEWQVKCAFLEGEVDALVKERDLYNKNYLELESQNARMKEALKEALKEWDDYCEGESSGCSWYAEERKRIDALQQLSNQGE